MNNDKARLPKGQILTSKFPVLSSTATPNIDIDSYRLRVFGVVEKELNLSFNELLSLGVEKRILDFHCVTHWSRLGDTWEGIPLKKILDLAKPKADYLMLYSSYSYYSANVPMSYIDDNAMLAIRFNGKPLEPDHGGPIRAIIPTLYAWKSVKWIDGIEVMRENNPGFWEQRGYHLIGDYTKEQRYAEGINFVNKLLFFRRSKSD
ncbi:MAG: sulfoxide reductase catalytic subunit YedY [Candidatus Micrarchaeota archaeon]|nr:MAG: sulfoxide reductase catalytic subunit YedY [Candidatus Micrarchaeota archaeon]